MGYVISCFLKGCFKWKKSICHSSAENIWTAGYLPLIDKDKPTLSFIKIAEEYGPIFQIQTLSDTIIVVSGHELVAEVCDETRFDKSIEGALAKVRAFAGDGLFTSETHEPNWKKPIIF